MRFFLVLWSACSLGCALPKVALGGSVTTGAATNGDGRAQRTLRSALWLAMSYAPHAGRDAQPSRPISERASFEHEPLPCAIDVACTWEREAAYEAAWGRAAEAPLDPESEM